MEYTKRCRRCSSGSGSSRRKSRTLSKSSLALSLVSLSAIILSTQINQHACGPLNVTSSSSESLSARRKLTVQQQQQQATNRTTTTSRATTAAAVPTTRSLESRKSAIDYLARTFIEQVETYPQHEIELIMKRTPQDIKDLFNVAGSEMDAGPNLTERKASHYHVDHDFSSEEHEICSTTVQYRYPRQVRRRNMLYYVPNDERTIRQVVRTEVCDEPNIECKYLMGSLPDGLVSSCHQKYSYQRLLFYDQLEQRMTGDSFRYPSCCTCVVRPSASSVMLFDRKFDGNESNSTIIVEQDLKAKDTSGADAKLAIPADTIVVETEPRSPSTRESKSVKDEHLTSAAARSSSRPTANREPESRILSSDTNPRPTSRKEAKKHKPAASSTGTVVVLTNDTVLTSSNSRK